MIETRGTVVSCSAGKVQVRTERPLGGCGRCHETGGCGGQAAAGDKACAVVEVTTPLLLRAGDPVRLRIHETRALHSALISYGLAIVCLLVGAGLAAWWPTNTVAERDVAVMFGAVLGLVCAAVCLRWLERSRALRRHLQVEVSLDEA